MLLSTLSASYFLMLGAGSLVAGTPVLPRITGVPDAAWPISKGIIVLPNKPEPAHTDSKRDASPEPQGLWGLSFPNLFPSSGSAASTASGSSVPSATSAATSTATPTTSDAAKALSLHNAARQAKGIPNLVWDKSLQAQALTYAQQLALVDVVVHSATVTRPNQGENLAYVGATNPFTTSINNPLEVATNGWLAEASNCNGETIPNGNFANYGHYTQIMWNTTTNVGIAAAKNWLGVWYIVARYSPPGNVLGQKPY